MANLSDGEVDGSGWIDPRRPLTAVTSAAGGPAGGEKRRRCGQKRRLCRSPVTKADWSDWLGRSRAPFVSSYVRGDPYAPHPRYGNLIGRHARPANPNQSGGVAGVSPSPSSPVMMQPLSPAARFLHRQPPVGQGVDGGVERENADSEADQEVEGESEAKVSSDGELESEMTPGPTFPFKVSTDAWEVCLAEAEEEMKKHSFYRSTLSTLSLSAGVVDWCWCCDYLWLNTLRSL